MTDVIGWYLIGPMEAVCFRHADTAEEARALTQKWVASVLPIYAGNSHRAGEDPVCVVCGELVRNN